MFNNELDIITILANDKIMNTQGKLVNLLLHRLQYITMSSKLPDEASILFNILNSDLSIEQVKYKVTSSFNSKLIESINNKLDYFSKLSNFEEINKYNKIVNDWVNKYLFNTYLQEYINNKNLDIFFSQVHNLPSLNITLDNIKSVDNMSNEIKTYLDGISVIKSRFDYINKSLHYNGYLKGTLNCVAAPTGKGKTHFLLQEALNFINNGNKVLYVGLGDLINIDFIIRLCSLEYDVSQREVLHNLDKYYNNEFKLKLSNFDYLLYSPGEICINDIVSIIKSKISNGINYDCIILDYDSNFKDIQDDGMYNGHNNIYNKARYIASIGDGSVVFIGSQVKPEFTDIMELPINSLQESSRKQTIVDTLITLNRRENELGQSYGIINIPKSRRGDIGKFYFTSSISGRISEVNKQEYNNVCNATKAGVLLKESISPEVEITVPIIDKNTSITELVSSINNNK